MGDLVVGILLFGAIVLGWLLGKLERGKSSAAEGSSSIGRDYYDGLNLLLNERQDEAIDLLLNTLDVSGETFETYMVMGGLYRRRGEVERAIRIRQDLLARTDLTKLQNSAVRLELARDYLKAGVLDRAERLLKEILDDKDFNQVAALEHLESIYEQEREWGDAIKVAEQLISKGRSRERPLAHYYCEQADDDFQQGDVAQARRLLKKALQMDRNCVRASLILAQLETQTGHSKEAIKVLKRVPDQDAAFVPDALPLLRENYTALGQGGELIRYLLELLEQAPSISIVIELSELMAAREGESAGAGVLSDYIRSRPSIRGLDRMIGLQLQQAAADSKDNLQLLKNFTEQLIALKPIYRCEDCGFEGKVLNWRCPSCKAWGTTKPIRGMEGE